MLRICGRAAETILAGGLVLSLISVADAAQCNTAAVAAAEPKHSVCQVVRPKVEHLVAPSRPIGQPRQDPRDAWGGFFANPFDNSANPGSNGG